MTPSNGSRGLATLRQSLADLQRVITRPQTAKPPKIPTPAQAAQKLVEVAELPLATLEGLGRVEQLLGRIETLLRNPPAAPIPQGSLTAQIDQLSTRVALLQQQKGVPITDSKTLGERWAKAHISSASVTVGDSQNLEAEITDFWGRPLAFAHITITGVAISAPQLVNADAVRLRLYRRGTRAEPQDLLAEFDGASQVAGMWAAAFTNRQIEFSGLDERSKVYLTVRNTAGNSGPTTFQVFIYGLRYPAVAPPVYEAEGRRRGAPVDEDSTLVLTP